MSERSYHVPIFESREKMAHVLDFNVAQRNLCLFTVR